MILGFKGFVNSFLNVEGLVLYPKHRDSWVNSQNNI